MKKYSSAGALEATIGASLHIPGSVATDLDDSSIIVAADVNEYRCELGNYPEIAVFDPTGALRESFELTGFPDKQEPVATCSTPASPAGRRSS